MAKAFAVLRNGSEKMRETRLLSGERDSIHSLQYVNWSKMGAKTSS